MLTIGKWNKNKMIVAPIAAVLLWLVSMICFVFGLSFNQPLTVFGVDMGFWIALIMALCNTAIQLTGNDMKFEDKDWVFLWVWRASYVLGIASNVNTLLKVLGMENWYLEFAVALSFGTIIEVAPEKLIIMWLRQMTKNAEYAPKPNFQPKPQSPQHVLHQPITSNPNYQVRKNEPGKSNHRSIMLGGTSNGK